MYKKPQSSISTKLQLVNKAHQKMIQFNKQQLKDKIETLEFFENLA
mgnify:CR=1 FL=1